MSRIDACYAHLVFSPCAVGALLKQDSIGAAGIPWWLRRSCHPTQLASQQCTQMPQTNVERPFSPICVHSYCVFPCGRARRPRLAGLGATPPQPGGGLLERICPVGPLFIVPRRLAGGLRSTPPGRRRDGKAHSARRGGFRLRLSVRRRARLCPSARPHGPPPQPRRRPPQVGPGDRHAPAAARDVAAGARLRPCE